MENGKNCIIHLGYPKTATTFLQRKIFANLKEVINIGKPHFNNKFYHIYKEVHSLISEPSITYDNTNLSLIINNLKEKNKKILLSDEAFTWNNSLDHNVYLDRFDKIFKNYKVIFVLRNQVDIISSYYNYTGFTPKPYYRFNTTISFEHFYRYEMKHFYNSFFYRLDYYNFIKFYENHIGKDNILVLLYEDMIYDKDKYVKQLSNFIGVDENEVKKLFEQTKEKENSSSFKLNDYLKNIIKYPFRAQKRNISTNEIKSHYSLLCDYYIEGNKQLEKNYNLDLQKYMYPLKSDDSGVKIVNDFMPMLLTKLIRVKDE